MNRYRSHTCDLRPIQTLKAEPMTDTVTEMALSLYTNGVDLYDRHAAIRHLTESGFKTSHINVFLDDALDAAREIEDEPLRHTR